MPKVIEAQLATLVTEVPEGDEWLHELKLDGYRLLCHVDHGAVRLVTRAGNDWTSRFPELAQAVAKLPVKSAILDGEAVVLDNEGRSQFQALQQVVGNPRAKERSRLALFLFDLLHLDGRDLRSEPLTQRKERLQKLVARGRPPLRYSDHVRGNGADFFEAACQGGVEGVVSKRADSPYSVGRSRTWLKIKCSRRQEFIIVGFSDPEGSRVGLGALLLGVREDGHLRYAGKVGTGFSGATLLRLRKMLEPMEQPRPAVTNPPSGRGVHWVKPNAVAEVSFTEWTSDGRIRHPSFVGLREDKPASEVTAELEQPVSRLSGRSAGGLRGGTLAPATSGSRRRRPGPRRRR